MTPTVLTATTPDTLIAGSLRLTPTRVTLLRGTREIASLPGTATARDVAEAVRTHFGSSARLTMRAGRVDVVMTLPVGAEVRG